MAPSDFSITAIEADVADFDHVVDLRFLASTSPSIDGAIFAESSELISDPAQFISGEDTPTLIVCDVGIRSMHATRSLREMGYTNVQSMAGGMEAWFEADLPVTQPGVLTSEQYRRYDRQMKIPGVGVVGQSDLQNARVVIVGAGGLGVPVLSYLTGSGVGHITIIDSGNIELSNLHRQTIYSTSDIGSAKAVVAAAFAARLNPEIDITARSVTIDSSNAEQVLQDHDVIVVCTDRFDTTQLVNSASVTLGIPMVFGSVYRTEGQLAVFDAQSGPCYACVFPADANTQTLACAIVGVLGSVTGVIGSMQASEVVKLLTDVGGASTGMLHLYNAIDQSMTKLTIRKNPTCAVCGDS